MSDSKTPRVGIIMGSESDLPVMKGAAEILQEFEVPFEIRVLSAHRTPHLSQEYAESALDRGLQVIIAGAGGAAHLAGVIAAGTPLPVLGVPVLTKVDGLDSLLSMVQMPSGIPVGTLAINGAKNAALLAIQILATSDPDMLQRMVTYKAEMVEKVKAMDGRVQAHFE